MRKPLFVSKRVKLAFGLFLGVVLILTYVLSPVIFCLSLILIYAFINWYYKMDKNK